jgi:hypothetical protein
MAYPKAITGLLHSLNELYKGNWIHRTAHDRIHHKVMVIYHSKAWHNQKNFLESHTQEYIHDRKIE